MLKRSGGEGQYKNVKQSPNWRKIAQIQQGVVAVVKAWGEGYDPNTTATREA
jgi:hypothetical protein